MELGGCGEEAVVADAGCGGEAVGDLALHHEDGAGKEVGAGERKEAEEDFGGDVVGKVSDDVGGFAGRDESGEVGCEDVGVEDLDVEVGAEFEAEFGGEGGVELDGDEAAAARGEDGGDGAVAGADLDYGAGGDVAEGIGDCVAGAVVGEEVLAEGGLSGHGGSVVGLEVGGWRCSALVPIELVVSLSADYQELSS